MNILVTGSSGFIGHNIVKMLDGYNVIGFDNHEVYPSVDWRILKMLINERLAITSQSEKFKEHRADVTRGFPHLGGLNYDVIIHTASFPNQHEVSLHPFNATNTMILGLMGALTLAQHCKKFVFISSSMVYGDYPNFATESHPTNPNTLYGVLKDSGEKIVRNFTTTYGIPHTIIRPSAVYGERDVSSRLVGKFITTAIEGGTLHVNGPDEILDFTYVEDVAQGIVQAAFSDNTNNKTYNLTRSDAKCRTILEAGELAIALAGKGTLSIQGRDTAFPKRGNLSIEQARNDFGYNPTTNIEDGFQRYYEWLHSFLKRQASV